MSSRTLCIGVIGAGAIAPSHIHAIGRCPRARLSAVCDVVAARAAALAAPHGVPHFATVSAMLDAGVADAVTICTPSGYHLMAAQEAIAGGCHVLVEKPLEIDTGRVDQIVDAARAQGVLVGGVFQSRFRPVATRLHALVQAGCLGELYSGSAYIKRYRTQAYYDSGSWRGTWAVDGGGCLMNQGIHIVDLLLWFMGDVDRVSALADSAGRDVEVETRATALLRFAGGQHGVIEATTLAFPELPQYLELYGSRGTLTFNSEQLWRLELIDPSTGEAEARDELLALSARNVQAKAAARAGVAPGTAVPVTDMGHTPVVADFVDAVLDGRSPQVDGTEARRSVALINAVYESARSDGRPLRPG